MARTHTPWHAYLVFAALAAVPLGTADASPIPHQITYSTQWNWPGPMPGAADGTPVFEFQGVQNETAALGSVIKLGTVLVHQTSPGSLYFDGTKVPVDFLVTAIDGKRIDSMGSPVQLEGVIYGAVYPEGTVAAGLSFQGMYNPLDLSGGYLSSFRAGDLSLKLDSLTKNDFALSNLTPGTPVVAVDVYGVLAEVAPVPEPGTWLIFAGAAFFAGARVRRAKR